MNKGKVFVKISDEWLPVNITRRVQIKRLLGKDDDSKMIEDIWKQTREGKDIYIIDDPYSSDVDSEEKTIIGYSSEEVEKDAEERKNDI